MDTKLVVIDGNSILYREYFALSTALRNNQGQPTNAIFGFANQIVKIINELHPTHMVVAFDVSKKTFRNDIFDGYKAHRKPMPDDLRAQLEPLRKMLSLMNIKYLEKQGLEGDDIVGTIAKRFDVPTIIITGDRDTFQLIDDTTVVYRNKKGMSELEKLGENEIKEMFGLSPHQLVYVKALAGDTSDNILGVSGVGEKTALNLIQQYGDLDGVYANIENIKGSLKEKLMKDKEMAYISLKLAKINTNVDISCDLDELKFDYPFGVEVLRFFQENNFKTLLKKTEIFAKIDEQSALSGGTDYYASCVIKNITNAKELTEIIDEIKTAKILAFAKTADEFRLCYNKDEIIIKIKKDLIDDGMDEDEIVSILKPVLEDGGIEKIVFNSKAVMHYLDSVGVNIKNYKDILVAKHLADGKIVKGEEDLFLDDDFKKEFFAKSLLVAKEIYFGELKKQNSEKLYYEIELPLTKILFDMEKAGVKVDLEKLAVLEEKYKAELGELTRKIYLEAGHEFNINSPKQTAEIIYDELHLKNSKKKSTAIEELELIENRHPIVPLIIRHRKVSKFLSNFLVGKPSVVTTAPWS